MFFTAIRKNNWKYSPKNSYGMFSQLFFFLISIKSKNKETLG